MMGATGGVAEFVVALTDRLAKVELLHRSRAMLRLKPPLFANRAEAGRRLGERLRGLGLERPVVYALPRGGVSVASEIAAALGAPLDLILVRKLGAPCQAELALGAVVEGEPAEMVLNPDIVALTGAWLCYRTLAQLC